MFAPAAALVLALAFCLASCTSSKGGGHSYQEDGYFVQLNLERKDLLIDGETLSVQAFDQLMDELHGLLNGLEDKFSLEIDASDLPRVNAADAGEWVPVSEDTVALLEMSHAFTELTGGKFTPALFPLTELLGFAPSDAGHYNDSRPEPAADMLAAAKAVSDLSLFSWEGNAVSKAENGAALDFGGIAKGYMCDAVVSYIGQKYAGRDIDAIVNLASSNSAYLGLKRDGDVSRGYNIGIDNPRRLSTGITEGLYLVGVSEAAVTTSADNYRYYIDGDRIYSHIIDAETGKPADRGIISVTVVVPNAAHTNPGTFADSLSTAAFCMPLTQALQFFERLAEQYGIGAVIITRDFRYYTVGDITAMNRKEFAQYCNDFLGSNYNVDSIADVFTKGDLASAGDEIEPCEAELAYIARVKEILN